MCISTSKPPNSTKSFDRMANLTPRLRISIPLQTIIFLREINHLGHEISGYIDYRHRLNHQDWKHYFLGHKKLMPKVTDLCHYNWKNRQVVSNDTENFLVRNTASGRRARQ